MKYTQLLRGKEASVMRTQTTHCNPRSWKFSPDGTRLLIGFVNGDLQVTSFDHVISVLCVVHSVGCHRNRR